MRRRFSSDLSCLPAGQSSGHFVDGLFCPVQDHFWSLWKFLGAFRRTSRVPRTFYEWCDSGPEWNSGSAGPVAMTQLGSFWPRWPIGISWQAGSPLEPAASASTPDGGLIPTCSVGAGSWVWRWIVGRPPWVRVLGILGLEGEFGRASPTPREPRVGPPVLPFALLQSVASQDWVCFAGTSQRATRPVPSGRRPLTGKHLGSGCALCAVEVGA